MLIMSRYNKNLQTRVPIYTLLDHRRSPKYSSTLSTDRCRLTGITASLAPPSLDVDLTVDDRMKSVRTCLARSWSGSDATIAAYDVIRLYKTLVLACGLSVRGSFEDPKVRGHENDHVLFLLIPLSGYKMIACG